MLNLDSDNLLIICPNEEKLKILDSIKDDTKLYNIKFMAKKEYIDNYYFSYDERALIYLMKKYHYNLDVAKIYLKYLYIIDENKAYKDEKLSLLKKLKQELITNNLLIYNPNFKKYIATKKIIVKNYYDLEKFEEDSLNTKVIIEKPVLNTDVVECNTLEEEVNYVCLKIIDLLRKGVDINKIYLTNISSDYYYTLNKLFSYYKIPLNIDMKNSIYATKVVSDYLETKTLDLQDQTKNIINGKLAGVINSLTRIEDDSIEYKEILIDKLRHTYIAPKKRINAVNIKDLYNEEFLNDEYVFVLGFNQDILPKMAKDIDYITDLQKENLPLYKTNYINKRNKEVTVNILGSIANLFLSYKLSSPFSSFYPSSLINDLNLKVIKPDTDNLSSTNLYNELRLGEYLDLYNLYGEENANLKKLYTHYKIPYKTYANSFLGISNDTYLENLPYPLKLSYTSLNTYSECKFKYYIKYVLKLDDFTDTFASFIGSMYHKILSIYQKVNFNFEREYQNYLKTRQLSLKEKLLLVRIKKDLLYLIDTLHKQELITGFDDSYFEKKIDIPLKKKVEVIFTGTIDKIMYYQKIEDTYFSIIDYKTGTIDTHIEPMKYGLHMQLPVYLYLVHYSKVFKSPIFTGIYYQNILFNYPTWDNKTLEKTKKDRLKLQGYSTSDESIISIFDSTYEDSSYIKSMSYSDDKGFGRFTKTIDEDTLYDLVNYTKSYIDKSTDAIIEGDFAINPKYYDGKNVSCEFCQFKDLCYMSEKDLVYLDKVSDLSFLGGDANGMD